MKNITTSVIICLFICIGISTSAKDMEKKKYNFRNQLSKNSRLSNLFGHKKYIIVQNRFTCTLATDVLICNNGFCDVGFIYATASTCEQAGAALDLALKIMNCPQCFQL